MRLYAYERNDSKSSEERKQKTLKTNPNDNDRKKILTDINLSKRPEKMTFAPSTKHSWKAVNT